MRADARRNRDQIIDAARALFLEVGTHPPMEDVAHRAGVGVGTLYRRFPDRDALVAAVAEDTLTRLAELAATARAGESDAWAALRRFLREAVELRLGALRSVVEDATHDAVRAVPGLAAIRARLADDLAWLVARAQADGALRKDVGLAEIGAIMTLRTTPTSDRVIAIVLDGLKA